MRKVSTPPPTAGQAIVYQPGQGDAVSLLGNTAVFKVNGEDTNRAYSLTHCTIGPGGNALRPHTHPFEETFYILSGTLTFGLAGKAIEAPAGSCVRIPNATLHTVTNASTESVTFLLIAVPAGIERYFIELAELYKISSVSPVDQEKVRLLWTKYGIEPP